MAKESKTGGKKMKSSGSGKSAGSRKRGGQKGNENAKKYRREYANGVFGLALLGLSNREIGEVYGVSDGTVRTWAERHKEFGERLAAGRMEADGKVAEQLFRKATGYVEGVEKLYS